MANALDLPRGIEPASGMLSRYIDDASVANAGTVEFQTVVWGLSPGDIIGVWGAGFMGVNIQADGDEWFGAVTTNPDQADATIQDSIGNAASFLWYYQRGDIVTSGGLRSTWSSLQLMLPKPVFVVRDIAVGLGQVSAGAARMGVQLYFQVFHAESARLVELAGLSLSR